jgi:hypothetical protein
VWHELIAKGMHKDEYIDKKRKKEYIQTAIRYYPRQRICSKELIERVDMDGKKDMNTIGYLHRNRKIDRQN